MIDTKYLERCIEAFDRAFKELSKQDEKNISYDIFRSAVIKDFEIILEQGGRLLKKCLVKYLHTHKAVDRLSFKDIFRQAAKNGLITIEETERWLNYRENRNATSHDYGVGLAEKTLPLIPQFIDDAKALVKVIQEENDTKK